MAAPKRQRAGKAATVTGLKATDARLTMRGLYWFKENEGRFWRLPARAKGVVRDPVWALGECPASAHLAFRSDTTSLTVRVRNPDAGHMMHFASTGSNGLALWVGAPGRERFWTVSTPDAGKGEFGGALFSGLAAQMREFRLYLPLYKALQDLELDFSAGAQFEPPSPLALPAPVVFYGTSITQGGCASTAGTDFVSTLGRRLNVEMINLGFSGNGCGEPEMAQVISDITASAYALDYSGNVDSKRMDETLPRFLELLRAKHATTPIFIITPLCYSYYEFSEASRTDSERKRDVMIAHYLRCRQAGDANVHLVDGYGLIPFGSDPAYVDGVHPTDAGFLMIAERLMPFLSQVLLRGG